MLELRAHNKPTATDREAAGETMSEWQSDTHPQPAQRTVFQKNFTAVATHHVAGDGQAQPNAAGCLIAGAFQPLKRLEHILAAIRWNAGAIIIDGDFGIAVVYCPR